MATSKPDADDKGANAPGDAHEEAPEKTFTADEVDADDPHKVEKLAKAGRPDAPDEAGE